MTAAETRPQRGHGGGQPPWLTLCAAATCALLFVLSAPPASELLHDRAAISSGEIWRLATGHFIHVDAAHLAWNVAALLGLGWLVETAPGGAGRLAASLAAGCLGVSAWLLAFEPELQRYCGLSGALNALYAVLLVDLWRRTRWFIYPALLVADIAKIAWELASGGPLLTDVSWPPVPEAHAAGLVAGLLLAVVRDPAAPRRADQPPCLWRRRRRSALSLMKPWASRWS